MIGDFLHRLGRRGALLCLFGMVSTLYGLSLFTNKQDRFGHLGEVITTLVAGHWLRWLWIICGLIAVVVALLPRNRFDGLGFIALLVPASIWTCLYAVSLTLCLVTSCVYGDDVSWIRGLIWLGEVIMILVTAGWPDPVVEGRSPGE